MFFFGIVCSSKSAVWTTQKIRYVEKSKIETMLYLFLSFHVKEMERRLTTGFGMIQVVLEFWLGWLCLVRKGGIFETPFQFNLKRVKTLNDFPEFQHEKTELKLNEQQN